ncbi:MAG: alkaline phosphatase family protein [Opitutaceae bacterium]|nr:alkaline phosphatase family protein [Opitutaceae bacterium]
MRRHRLFAACAGLLVALPSARAADPAPLPALVVVITIDQFRADYLARFGPHFGPGGFRLMLEQGASFSDCHYRHAVAKTASGHAVVLTGVHADTHGIIANDWIDRATMLRVNCVDDDTVQIVGLPETRGGVRVPTRNPALGASARRLLAPTVGDEFKLSRGPGPKVIGVSSKDRSAILLAGKFADAAYWMDKGRIVSSTAYVKELPAWVQAFNDSGRVEAAFGRSWERLLPVAAYDALQGPDDAPGEAGEAGMGRTLPKRVDGGAKQITPAFYDAFEGSPFKNEVLIDFARTLVEQEKLGRRGFTDILCLSFSTNDTVGHNYGPDSHEVMDITLRTDRQLADFLKFLDAQVGLANCTIVLTADHGVAPLPERIKALNPATSAGRIDNTRVLKTCEAALDRAFGALAAGRRWLAVDASQLLFFQDVLREKNIAPAAAEKIVRDALLTLEFVDAAFTRSELEAGVIADAYALPTLRSFHRERSGDVFYRAKPFWVERRTGTNHGTPYNYDTHVPLLWLGRGVKPGSYSQPVGVDDIAPTLARILGVLAPPQAGGRSLF